MVHMMLNAGPVAGVLEVPMFCRRVSIPEGVKAMHLVEHAHDEELAFWAKSDPAIRLGEYTRPLVVLINPIQLVVRPLDVHRGLWNVDWELLRFILSLPAWKHTFKKDGTAGSQ